MKNKLGATFVFASFITLTSFAQQLSSFDAQKGIRNAQIKPAIKVASVIDYRNQNTPNGNAIVIRKSIEPKNLLGKSASTIDIMSANTIAKEYLDACASELNMNIPSQQFELLSMKVNHDETLLRLNQVYQGIPVYGSEMLMHAKGTEVTLLHGSYSNQININSTKPAIASNNAVLTSIADVKSKTVFRQLNETEQSILKYSTPSSSLIIYKNDENKVGYTLCWHIKVRPNLLEVWDYYIDAQNGNVLSATNYTCAADGPKTAIASDINLVNRTIGTYQVGSTYYMIDASKTMFNASSVMPKSPDGTIWTLDAQNTAGLSLAQVTSNDNTTWSPKAVTAQYNASTIYDYFKNTHGINSFNNQNGNVISIVNVTAANGNPLDNMYWNGEALLYGNGNTAYRPLVGSMDMAAHEFTHGIIQSTANLEYQGQSGAINESMADVFGCMLDKSDWTIGEDVAKPAVFPSGAVRNFQDPHNQSTSGNIGWQPSIMSEYYTGSNDNGGVHLNSGILNRAFYLFAGSVSTTKAEKIYFHALTNYLTRYATFSDLRFAIIQSASDLYTSTESAAAATAFDAVGIYDNGNVINYAIDLPANNGIEKILSYDPNYFNINRHVISKTDGTSPTFISQSTAKRKPSLTDDGSLMYFVDTLNKIHRINLVGATNEAILFPTDNFYANVAVSKDGSKLAAITTAVDTSIFIYNFVTTEWYQIKLYNSTYVAGANSPGMLFADGIEWDYNGENILFDAKYKLGDSTTFWDISTINVWNNSTNGIGSGKIEKLISQPNHNVSVFNASFSKNSPYIITYEMYNKLNNTYSIMSRNLLNGKGTLVSNNNMIGTPTYTRLDDKIIFTNYDNAILDTAIRSVAMDVSKLNPIGGPITIVPHQKWGSWYTQGQRSLINNNKSLLRFSLPSLSPVVNGIIINDSVLLRVNQTDSINNLVANFITSPFTSTDVASVLQISGNTANNFNTTLTYRIKAKDNTTKSYTVITQRPNQTKQITSFSFQDLSPVVVGNIKNDTIWLNVPVATDVTDLVATFTNSAFSKVSVNGFAQKSGVNYNTYITPLVYRVTAYDSTTRDYVVIVTKNVGINEVAIAKTISVYPNPSSDKIYVEVKGVSDYKIYSVAGKLESTGKMNNQTILIESLTPGMYFVTFTSEGKHYSGKFIKN